jgi:hypothetical protein
MEVIKNNWQLITIAVLIIILIVSISTRPSPSDAVLEYKLQRQVDSLNVVIAGYKSERLIYTTNIDSLNSDIAVLKQRYDSTQTSIDQIRDQYEAVISDISNYTTNDVTIFFADRYR